MQVSGPPYIPQCFFVQQTTQTQLLLKRRLKSQPVDPKGFFKVSHTDFHLTLLLRSPFRYRINMQR